MVANIDALRHPAAAGLCIRALDDKLIQHRLDDPGHRADVAVGFDGMATGGTCSARVLLGRPCMVETLAAEVVFARELDGPIKRRVAYEADEVAVGLGEVFEVLEFGRDFDDSAVSTLRRG